MRKRNLLTSVLALSGAGLLITGSIGSAFAQVSSKSDKREQCQPMKTTKNLVLSDFYKLTEAPPTSSSEKGEFETTEEFQTRLANQKTEVAGYGFTVSDHVMIEFPVGERMQYDADQGLLKVKNLGLDYTGIFPIKLKQGNFQGTAITTLLRSESFYNGSNAFGAQIRVRRQEVDLVAIAWPKKTIKVRKHSKQVTFRNYPADQAKAFRERGKIRVMGKIILPVAERAATIATTPTFSNPLERRNTFAVLTMLPTDVCLIDHNEQVIDQWLIGPRKRRK